MKFLIAAGGTGGHINPGIAIANMLVNRGDEVKFIGTTSGMEKDLIPKAGFDIEYIHAEGIHRGFSLKNFSTLINLKKGINECQKIIKEEKPDLVIGTGGYVTAPLMIAGLKMKIPTMIHESNALPGKTTNWLSKKVDVIALGFNDAKNKIPQAKNAVFTGNPTKMNVTLTKEDAKKKLGISEKLVLIFGGSQGARKINNTVAEIINENKELNYKVIFATGLKNYDEVISQVKVDNKNFQIEKYIYNMDEIMRASDLVVCRSGALTVTEIAVVGVPAIMIPFPFAAENHQYFNAKTLEDAGAGIIIEEKDLTKEILKEKIESIINDNSKMLEMSTNAKKVGDEQAIYRIEQEINKLLA